MKQVARLAVGFAGLAAGYELGSLLAPAVGRIGFWVVTLATMFAVAGIADAEDLEIMKSGSEFFSIADLELAFFEDRIVELDHGAAGRADQVIVMRVSADVFVVVVVFAEVNAPD